MSNFSVQNVNTQESLANAESVQNGLKLVQGQILTDLAATVFNVTDANTGAPVQMPAGAIPIAVILRTAITPTTGGATTLDVGASLTAGGAIVANNGLITQIADHTTIVAGSQSVNISPLGAAFVPDFGTNQYVSVTVGAALTSAAQTINVDILCVDVQN